MTASPRWHSRRSVFEQHGQGAVVQVDVVVQPEVVVVVAGDGGGERLPHPATPVQLAVAVQQDGLGEPLGDRLAGAVAAPVVEHERVDGHAGNPLRVEGAQTGEREVPAVVRGDERGDTRTTHDRPPLPSNTLPASSASSCRLCGRSRGAKAGPPARAVSLPPG